MSPAAWLEQTFERLLALESEAEALEPALVEAACCPWEPGHDAYLELRARRDALIGKQHAISRALHTGTEVAS